MRAPFALMILPVCALPLSAADAIDYLRDVKPLLARHCYACHGAEKQRSGLRLDTAKAAFEGGNSGAVVVKGKSGDSRLIHAILGSNDLKVMPPKGPRLSEKEI